ncbi:NAD(P)-dependent alcohol dehydrogenase [Thauera linaloolentis]|uniref:Aryl-alcohol dehydrogenase XylB n=1 Tax=Thauera linaloolentis (strain DSM 12138 / JCM 21573 / CCUG 41526 / CIP 105981 / IAM 15112 / NBRC 102519 / 47Lol) TaxID=1123367 RepID=N6YP23_THAL4|nr:NAD(P)-dependent alcohol dehydrogenase [Thauera linaloolentis]ENO84122.1 aryl-alcohol dehydrogenase XylB [Thauera linaloolentis 47Lol = DSM 12138]MCM8565483.1 NAD(P)-dependent alcohol dehydrogenase [Thauera linaloolentis]
MEIQAAIVKETHGRFSIESLELSAPQADEVLVRIVASGMCHTDLAVRDQHIPLPLPMVLGHEGAGVVVEVGANVRKVAPGDHVVLTFASCGQCPRCLQGKPAYCDAFLPYNVGTCRPDGSCTHHQHGQPVAASFFYQSSFATHAIAHHRNVVKVPSDLPLDTLAPLGCGIQTGAGTVLNCLKPAAGSSIAVFGIGAVGLSAVMAAKVAGCATIVAVDVHAERLALARELGATHAVNGRDGDAVAAIQALQPGGVDFSVEATGIPAVMAQAVEALSGLGTAVLLGVAPAGAQVSFNAATLLGGRTIRSSIEGDSVPDVFIPQLIGLYRRGLFPFDRMARHYALADINQAVADSESGATIKPILRMPA